MSEPHPPDYDSAISQKVQRWLEEQTNSTTSMSSNEYQEPPPPFNPDYTYNPSPSVVFAEEILTGEAYYEYPPPNNNGSRRMKKRRRMSLHGASRKTMKLARSASFKMKKFEEKHHVISKTKNMARGTSQKLKDVAIDTSERMRDFDEKHRVSEKTRSKFKEAATFVRRKLSPP